MDELLDREGITWNEYYRAHGYAPIVKEPLRVQFWRDYWKNPSIAIRTFEEDILETMSIADETREAVYHGVRWLFPDFFESS